jgi:hypothetical protein
MRDILRDILRNILCDIPCDILGRVPGGVLRNILHAVRCAIKRAARFSAGDSGYVLNRRSILDWRCILNTRSILDWRCILDTGSILDKTRFQVVACSGVPHRLHLVTRTGITYVVRAPTIALFAQDHGGRLVHVHTGPYPHQGNRPKEGRKATHHESLLLVRLPISEHGSAFIVVRASRRAQEFSLLRLREILSDGEPRSGWGLTGRPTVPPCRQFPRESRACGSLAPARAGHPR